MVRQGRSQTFLWELAVAILFFALAAAVTLQLFAEGSRQSEENSARNGAMLAAVSAAEQIAGADSPELSVLGGRLDPGVLRRKLAAGGIGWGISDDDHRFGRTDGCRGVCFL